MPLNKLDNFIKNTDGRTLYVNPNDLEATDSIENQGNSLAKPFKTIQRALIESARFSYLKGNNNDKIEQTTILLFPGEHVVDNRPGFAIFNDASLGVRVTSPDGTNSPPSEEISLNLPGSLDESLIFASSNNIDLQISEIDYQIAARDLNIEKSRLSPTASINFSKTENKDLSTSVDEVDEEEVKATITWPIIKGGENISSIKKSSYDKQRSKLILQDTKNRIITETTNSWSKYQSSKSVLEATKAQLKAAEIASEGISLEYDSGNNRTTLEVIQSNSFLLNAQISLANSERNYLLSQFNLLRSIGLLNSDYLKIK